MSSLLLTNPIVQLTRKRGTALLALGDEHAVSVKCALARPRSLPAWCAVQDDRGGAEEDRDASHQRERRSSSTGCGAARARTHRRGGGEEDADARVAPLSLGLRWLALVDPRLRATIRGRRAPTTCKS